MFYAERVAASLPPGNQRLLHTRIQPERAVGKVRARDAHISTIAVDISNLRFAAGDVPNISAGFLHGVDVKRSAGKQALHLHFIERDGVYHEQVFSCVGLRRPYFGPLARLGKIATQIGASYDLQATSMWLQVFVNHSVPNSTLPVQTAQNIATALVRTVGVDLATRHPNGPHKAPALEVSLSFGKLQTRFADVLYKDMPQFVMPAPFGA